MRQLTIAAPVEAAALPDLSTYASTTAERYGLDPELFHAVIECESQFNPLAVSPTADYGIAQWHLAVHPDISLEQALNPYWSIERMAQEWAKGHARAWVCYQNITAPIDVSSNVR